MILLRYDQPSGLIEPILDGYRLVPGHTEVPAMLTALCKELHPALLYRHKCLVGLLKFPGAALQDF